MKYLVYLLTFFFCIQFSNSNAQSDGKCKLPKITYQQMVAEHDTLVSLIKQMSPVIYFNKEVRGIDFDKYARQLRKSIRPNTSMTAYLIIIKKTLNAAQDNHTSQLNTMLLDIAKKYWIPQKYVSFDSASTANMYEYVKAIKENYYSKAELNLVYTQGEYYNILPFTFNGEQFPANMKLVRCNGQDIHAFVKTLTKLASALRWDRVRNRVYDENFYWPAELYKNKLRLTFQDKDNKKYQLNLSSQDTLTFLAKKRHDYGYFSQEDTVVTHYFSKQGIFYVKLPAMREELGDTVKRRMETVFKNNKVKSVVIDIRGNGGGSDNTYNKFMRKLITDTLRKKVVVARNFSPAIQAHYHINRDSVLKSKIMSFDTDGPTLTSQPMYYIKQNFDFVVPDSANYAFQGKIYVLQDKFIYSSASNLSSLANNSRQLVSIGETPDLLSGLQANTIITMLPYSKFIFRVEPQIDLTGIKTKADIFQNHVGHRVAYRIDELYLRMTTTEDIFGQDFLMNHDPMFAKVLELEKE